MFYTAKDIDEEFIPGIEELLADTIPSFKWLLKEEENINPQTHLCYYIFFTKQNNSPVGIALFQLEKKEKGNPWYKIGVKNNNELTINCYLPSFLGEGWYFLPQYKEEGTKAIWEIIEHYFQKRACVQVKSTVFDGSYSKLTDDFQVTKNHKNLQYTLLKTHSDYQEYLASLSKTVQTDVKNQWKQLHQAQIKFGEFESLKELFSYRSQAYQSLYKKLKTDSSLAPYTSNLAKVLSLESEDKILVIIFMIKGVQGHYFYHILPIDSDIEFNTSTLHQQAIFNFYSMEESQKLHPCSQDGEFNLSHYGLQTRNQTQLVIKP